MANNIKINKDFKVLYKDDFFKGFSLKETAYIALGFLLGGGVAVGLHFLTGLEIKITVYFGIAVAAVIIFLGCYLYKGFLPLSTLLERYLELGGGRRITYKNPDLMSLVKREPFSMDIKPVPKKKHKKNKREEA